MCRPPARRRSGPVIRLSGCAEDGDHGQVIVLAVVDCGFGEDERGGLLAQECLSPVESEERSLRIACLNHAGFHPLILDMSEFQKMDGGLSCLSLRF